MNTPNASDVITTPLWRALIRGDITEMTVKDAAQNPDLYQAAVVAARDVDRLIQPAGEKGAVEAVGPIKIMWPPKDIPAEEDGALAWWIIFRRALADIPRSALNKAVDEYIRTSKYPKFPTPGDLRALAEPHVRDLHRVVARVKMVAKYEPPKRISDEDKAAGAELMRGLAADLAARGRADREKMFAPRARAHHERHAAAEAVRAEADRLDREGQA